MSDDPERLIALAEYLVDRGFWLNGTKY